MSSRPSNVGIVAMDMYFPSTYVRQAELEKFDNVSSGKYTVGLGQSNLAFCDQLEDINSTCLTAVHNLMEKYGIDFKDIGRLEVGTETMVDKSKAVKTTLMRLFQEKNNFDIEGIDSKNACYGGTAALLNSLAWMESSAWDGRYALVVAGDIAVYERGPARPTGGAGVVAMLIGPNAPIVVEPRKRTTRMEDVYDFYKPTMISEYPRVDGHLSNACYVRALDDCYSRLAGKYEAETGKPFTLKDFDYAVFHAPYNKLVQKSFGRLAWSDFLRHPDLHPKLGDLAQFRTLTAEQSYEDRDLMKALATVSKADYKRMVGPSELLPRECGNTYCGSVYAGLLSLISNEADVLKNKRAMMFSYGSGLAATLFMLDFKGDVRGIRDTADIKNRLAARQPVDPQTFTDILDQREKSYTLFDYKPSLKTDHLFPGTYYLSAVDKLERRFYERRQLHTLARRAPSAAAPRALPAVGQAFRVLRALRR